MHFPQRWDGTLLRSSSPDDSCPGRTSRRPVAADAPGRCEPMHSATGADRVAQVRERVRDGFYSSPAGVDALAHCLVSRGAV